MIRVAKFSLALSSPALIVLLLPLTTLMATYLAREVLGNRLELRRLSSLHLDAERGGIELVSQIPNASRRGTIGLIDAVLKQVVRNACVTNDAGITSQ